MRNIKTVEFRRLHSFGMHENVTVGAVAEVGPNETADAALTQVRAWVEEQIGAAASSEPFDDWRRYKQREMADIEAQINRARERWQRVEAWAEKVGIPLARYVDADDLPFD